MSLRIELMKFESILKNSNKRLFDRLKPGKSEKEIIEIFSKIDIYPNDNILNIYSWKNGVDVKDALIGQLKFGVNGIFTPIEAGIGSFIENKKINFYNSNLFQIFYDNIHMISVFSGEKIFTIDEQYVEYSVYDSLYCMFYTINQGFMLGYLSYQEGMLTCNYDEFWTLAAEINKESDYWKI